jgi:hypothetical protein
MLEWGGGAVGRPTVSCVLPAIRVIRGCARQFRFSRVFAHFCGHCDGLIFSWLQISQAERRGRGRFLLGFPAILVIRGSARPFRFSRTFSFAATAISSQPVMIPRFQHSEPLQDL